MHHRVADLITDANTVVDQFYNVTEFSTDAAAPTLTTGQDGQQFASVFVREKSWKDIAVRGLCWTAAGVCNVCDSSVLCARQQLGGHRGAWAVALCWCVCSVCASSVFVRDNSWKDIAVRGLC